MGGFSLSGTCQTLEWLETGKIRFKKKFALGILIQGRILEQCDHNGSGLGWVTQ